MSLTRYAGISAKHSNSLRMADPPTGVRGLRYVVGRAKAEERVRGVIAIILVGVLVGLVFETPAEPASVIASAKTLAISVIAFYFGLHKGTPQHQTALETRIEEGTSKDASR
jgi:hypothetical protein